MMMDDPVFENKENKTNKQKNMNYKQKLTDDLGQRTSGLRNVL